MKRAYLHMGTCVSVIFFFFSSCGGSSSSGGDGGSSTGEVSSECPMCPVIDTTNIIANGWVWPVPHKILGQDWVHYQNIYSAFHLGADLMGNYHDPVQAIADGTVLLSMTDLGGYGGLFAPGGAMLVLHQTSTGTYFKVLYGHVDLPLPNGSVVKAGETIGYLNDYPNFHHLHFAIRPGSELGMNYIDMRGYTNSLSNTYGFVNPLEFLNTNLPLN